MNDLERSLLELRDVMHQHGMRGHEPPSEEQVMATMDRFNIPMLEEIVTWYRVLEPGSFVIPGGVVKSLERTADLYDEMRLTAMEDFDDPDDRSAVIDWFSLTVAGHGGIAIWTSPCDGPRLLIWRGSIWDLIPGTRYDQGLSAIVGEWIQAWRTGAYIMQNGRPAHATSESHKIRLI